MQSSKQTMQIILFSLIFSSSLALFLLPFCQANVTAAPRGRVLSNCGIQAIFNFGDSYSDTGNALVESHGGGYMGKFPYGMSIHQATGRFSDGYLIIDHIARRKHVESSLFLLTGASANDYLSINVNSSLQRMKDMVPDVIAAVKTYIKQLIINHGGTKVVVVGAFQIGCGVRFDFHGGTKFHCNNSSFNSLATLHNQLLKEELRRLRDEFPGTRIVYGDMWDAFQWIMDHFSGRSVRA
ncbi:unnamed protein product [Linum tenue]|uniref:Uncharacterized protein n=1 Tax=Linum tenue TaxID=586396 RepID=A0AAV0JND7_9ROSI|nr:unnamed protein product [Linum tenue]